MKIFVYQDTYGFICIVLSINGDAIRNKIEFINNPRTRKLLFDITDHLFFYEKRKKYWLKQVK